MLRKSYSQFQLINNALSLNTGNQIHVWQSVHVHVSDLKYFFTLFGWLKKNYMHTNYMYLPHFLTLPYTARVPRQSPLLVLIITPDLTTSTLSLCFTFISTVLGHPKNHFKFAENSYLNTIYYNKLDLLNFVEIIFLQFNTWRKIDWDLCKLNQTFIFLQIKESIKDRIV